MDSTETLEACTLTEELSTLHLLCVYTGRHVVQTQRNGDPIALFISILYQRVTNRRTDIRHSCCRR